MSDDDDDFWSAYIASTPEQDKDFAGCGRYLLYLVGFVLAALVLLSVL